MNLINSPDSWKTKYASLVIKKWESDVLQNKIGVLSRNPLARKPQSGSRSNKMGENWNDCENERRQTENQQNDTDGSLDNHQQAGESE